MMKVSFLCLCLTLVSITSAVQPGVKITLSRNALNYAASEAVKRLSSRVTSMSIPDQSGKQHHIEYSFTGNHVTEFSPPSSQITTQPLGWTINNIGIQIHGDWRYKIKVLFSHISDHGSYDLKLNGCSISVTVTLTEVNGRPHITVNQCQVQIGSVDVKFHGGASKLYNLFDGIVEKNLERSLQSQLTEEVRKFVNENANEVLSTMKVTVPLQEFTLDYSFLSKPITTPRYIQTANKGEIFYGTDRREAPFSPAPIAPPPERQMVTIQLSEYVMNSFAYSAFMHQKLNYNLTNADLQGKAAGFLNTTCAFSFPPKCIGRYVPELAKAYPDRTMMLGMVEAAPPSFSINEQNMTVFFTGVMNFWVQQSGQQPKFVFQTLTNVSFAVNASIEGNVIKAFVLKPRITLKLGQAALPISDVKQLNNIVESALEFFVIPNLNERIGKQGFELPVMEGVAYRNPTLTFQKSALAVSTDVIYTM